jgi:hypothetical protein
VAADVVENSTPEVEKKITIYGWKIGSHKFSTHKYGTEYDFFVPVV